MHSLRRSIPYPSRNSPQSQEGTLSPRLARKESQLQVLLRPMRLLNSNLIVEGLPNHNACLCDFNIVPFFF